MPEPPGSLAVEDPPCCSAGSNRVVFCDELHVGERDPARRRRRTAPTRIVELPIGPRVSGCKQEQASFTGVLGVGESSYVLGLYLIYRLSEKGKLLSVVPRHNYHNLRTQYHIRHIQVSKSEALASSVRSNPDCPETQADSACIEGDFGTIWPGTFPVG